MGGDGRGYTRVERRRVVQQQVVPYLQAILASLGKHHHRCQRLHKEGLTVTGAGQTKRSNTEKEEHQLRLSYAVEFAAAAFTDAR